MKKTNNRRGLTLLELMIVLIILVGLIALIGPRLLGSQRKADIKTTHAQIGNLVSALKMYSVDMKTFPSTEEGLAALLQSPEDEALARSWDGPYMDGKRLPVDPWGSEFQYEFSADEGSEIPRVTSPGPDKQIGTSDDIANQEANDATSAEGSSRSASGSTGSRRDER